MEAPFGTNLRFERFILGFLVYRGPFGESRKKEEKKEERRGFPVKILSWSGFNSKYYHMYRILLGGSSNVAITRLSLFFFPNSSACFSTFQWAVLTTSKTFSTSPVFSTAYTKAFSRALRCWCFQPGVMLSRDVWHWSTRSSIIQTIVLGSNKARLWTRTLVSTPSS